LLSDLHDIITIEDGEEYIKGENDTFQIEKQSSRWSIASLVSSLPFVGSAGDTSSPKGEAEADQPHGAGDRILDYNAIIKKVRRTLL